VTSSAFAQGFGATSFAFGVAFYFAEAKTQVLPFNNAEPLLPSIDIGAPVQGSA
jgi:hypothetical protein